MLKTSVNFLYFHIQLPVLKKKSIINSFTKENNTRFNYTWERPKTHLQSTFLTSGHCKQLLILKNYVDHLGRTVLQRQKIQTLVSV